MRNKFQKYLSGDHEGFSLVELIIVIAIMAILIGVVALAVIPYLNRSREAKDISTLDSILSSATSAVGTTQVNDPGSFTVDASGNITAGAGSASTKVVTEVNEVLGSGSKKMTSKKAKTGTVTCKFIPSANKIAVYVVNGTSVVQFDGTVTGISALNTTNLSVTAAEDGKAIAVVN